MNILPFRDELRKKHNFVSNAPNNLLGVACRGRPALDLALVEPKEVETANGPRNWCLPEGEVIAK